MLKITPRVYASDDVRFIIPIPHGFSAESTALLWFMIGLLVAQIVAR